MSTIEIPIKYNIPELISRYIPLIVLNRKNLEHKIVIYSISSSPC
jgi:hypothetical protein